MCMHNFNHFNLLEKYSFHGVFFDASMNLNAVAANVYEYDPDNNEFKLVGTSRTVLTSREWASSASQVK